MGNQTANPGRNSQPIVRHPLFPAIVALWFAALFGLGSMAVRASLLESLVISSHLDLIVPQAAPPLGITARVLVAALMAIVGGLIGIALARRLARPKPVARERRRGAAPLEPLRPISRYAAPDPLPEAEREEEDQPTGPARRAALVATGHEPGEFAPHEAAPLPGGQPQILDVTAFDFAGIDQPEVEAPAPLDSTSAMELAEFDALEPEAPAAWEPATASAAVADGHMASAPVRSFDARAEPVRAFDAPQTETVQPQAIEPALPESSPVEVGPATIAPASLARPFEGPSLPVESSVTPHVAESTQPGDSAVEPLRFDAPQEAPASFARAFDAPSAASDEILASAPETWESGVSSAEPDSETVELAQDAEIPSLPVEAPVEAHDGQADEMPLHLPRLLSVDQAVSAQGPNAAESSSGISDDDPMATLRNRKAALPSVDQLDEPEVDYDLGPVSQPLTDGTAEAVNMAEADGGFVHYAPPAGAAAQRLAGADLAELSPVELIERLALSLQRKRQAAPAGLRALLESESALARPAAEFATWPQAAASPRIEPVEAQSLAAPEPAPAPQTAPEPEAATARLTLPAALRPIDFSEYEHDDDQPVFVPARSITMPLAPEADAGSRAMPDYFALQAASEAASEPALPQVAAEPGFELLPAPVRDNADESEDDILAAGYSSLLNMSRPVDQRQQFVRIEDPDAETEAAEPVVIFPGQAMRAGTQFAAPAPGPVLTPAAPPPSLSENSGQVRRFDAPAQNMTSRDPDETERALRSALATLQRMSGAA